MEINFEVFPELLSILLMFVAFLAVELRSMPTEEWQCQRIMTTRYFRSCAVHYSTQEALASVTGFDFDRSVDFSLSLSLSLNNKQ